MAGNTTETGVVTALGEMVEEHRMVMQVVLERAEKDPLRERDWRSIHAMSEAAVSDMHGIVEECKRADATRRAAVETDRQELGKKQSRLDDDRAQLTSRQRDFEAAKAVFEQLEAGRDSAAKTVERLERLEGLVDAVSTTGEIVEAMRSEVSSVSSMRAKYEALQKTSEGLKTEKQALEKVWREEQKSAELGRKAAESDLARQLDTQKNELDAQVSAQKAKLIGEKARVEKLAEKLVEKETSLNELTRQKDELIGQLAQQKDELINQFARQKDELANQLARQEMTSKKEVEDYKASINKQAERFVNQQVVARQKQMTTENDEKLRVLMQDMQKDMVSGVAAIREDMVQARQAEVDSIAASFAQKNSEVISSIDDKIKAKHEATFKLRESVLEARTAADAKSVNDELLLARYELERTKADLKKVERRHQEDEHALRASYTDTLIGMDDKKDAAESRAQAADQRAAAADREVELLRLALKDSEADAERLRQELQEANDKAAGDSMVVLTNQMRELSLEMAEIQSEKLEQSLPVLVAQGLGDLTRTREQVQDLVTEVADLKKEVTSRDFEIQGLKADLIKARRRRSAGVVADSQAGVFIPDKRPRLVEDTSDVRTRLFTSVCQHLDIDLRKFHPQIDEKDGMTAEAVVSHLTPLLVDSSVRDKILDFMYYADLRAPACVEGVRTRGYDDPEVKEGRCFCSGKLMCLRIQRWLEETGEIKLDLRGIFAREESCDL